MCETLCLIPVRTILSVSAVLLGHNDEQRHARFLHDVFVSAALLGHSDEQINVRVLIRAILSCFCCVIGHNDECDQLSHHLAVL